MREIVAGRALWITLLLLCPLVGFSFIQAVSLYAEASQSAQQSPVLATSLSPFDGMLIPTLGSFYVGVTLLFPFVAIRALGSEKETGALRLLIQLPYESATLVTAKLVAIASAWLLCAVPALSALVIWTLLGGHLGTAETLNLLAGQLLYAPAHRRYRTICRRHCRQFRHRRNHHAGVYDRIVGVGFHASGESRSARLDIAALPDPNLAHI